MTTNTAPLRKGDIYRRFIHSPEDVLMICPQKLFQRYEGKGWVKGSAVGCWSAGAG